MNLSRCFRELHRSYQAELDDLTSDSEGRDVLRQRLTAKRREIGFLVQMMEISPEMVAVVFHQAFRFTRPAVLEHLLTLEPDDFPAWDGFADCFEWQPWAQPLAAAVLAEPEGERFLTLTLGLEYLQHRPGAAAKASSAQDEEDEDGDGNDEDRQGPSSEFPDDDADDARLREEAGNDWLAEQGFDRKD